MDCSFGQFDQIPKTLPRNTTSLVMKGNILLSILRNLSFADPDENFTMSSLENLDLSDCKLYKIDGLAFYGLNYLKSLFLNNNWLMAVDIAQPKALLPFKDSLKTLDIRENRMCYPLDNDMDEFLGILTNLEDLTMDICNPGEGNLGPGLSNLLSLQKLHLIYAPGGISNISTGMFDAVKDRLIELKLEPSGDDRQINTYNTVSKPVMISMGAFEFTNLTVLDLSWTYLGPGLGQILSQLGNCPIEKLVLDHVGIYTSSYLDINRFSKNLRNLRYLSLAQNAIGGLTVSPLNIEVISYAQNIFTPYQKYVMMLQLPLFHNLRGFNISYQQTGPDYPQCSKQVCELGTGEYETVPENLEWIDVSNPPLGKC